MSRFFSASFRALLAGAAFLLVIHACKKTQKPASNPADFVSYISAYSSGLLSKEAEIRIVLAKPYEKFPGANQAADASFLSFSPSIDGQLIWADQNSLVFKPAHALPAGESFEASLHLRKLYKSVPDELKDFNFNFQVFSQSYTVANIMLRTYSKTNLRLNKLEGEVFTGDVASVLELESLLSAKQNGKNLKVKWRQDAQRKTHFFTIDSVARTAQPGVVEFTWADVDGLGEVQKSFEIPALGDFKVLSVNVIQAPEQKVIINFSDPLLDNQNLAGLIQIEDAENLGFTIDNTELHVIVNGFISGERQLIINKGVKNAAGFAFKERHEEIVVFADVKPSVELIGNGSILPNSGNLVLPFKAVNLSAVDVYVLKIYADNVPQFLQTNQLEGDYQLKRVGRPIAYKRINLTGSTGDLKRWNNFSIDLAEMVKPEPGAVYRVEIKFKKAYSLYQCDGETPADGLTEVADDELNTAEYDSPDNYYWDDYYYDDYYWEDYDYQEQDNPCNSAYYTSRRNVSRNILATNLALTVKGGDKSEFTAIVTDIISAKPVSGATVQFLNYQQQELKSGTTDANGILKLKLDGKPFLAIAKSKGQSAYLRIDDGSSLSLSNFEVEGSHVQKGLKGFIYGERGVWRPGDTIHTFFMLEDADKTLPKNHPVIFEVRNPEGKTVIRQVKNTHVSGIYSFPFATLENSITGFYTAQVRVGGVSFQKSIRVETIKPNRLKINLAFDDGILKGNTVVPKLHSNWLTGAIARNLKADISMQMRQQSQPFEKYSKYTFSDVTRSFYSSENRVFEGVLNGTGDAMPNIKMGNYEQAPGMLEAVFVTRVFEQGGDMSIDRQAFNYAPFSHFVGILPPKSKNSPWLQTDQPINVGLVSVDADGKAQNRKLHAEVYAIDWSWWWSSGRNGFGNFTNSSYARVIGSFDVQTKQGLGSFNFKVNYPNYGNYLVRVCDEESGHCSSQIVYIDWPMSRDRSGRANPGAPTMLTFTADKDSYNTGDVAHLSVPTSSVGRLLVSVENGSEVLETFWVDAQSGQTAIDISITDKMTPNVYAFISYIQPHSKSVNDLPIRQYGVIPIMVNNARTQLKPVLKTASEWQPEKSAEIVVSETNGKAMTYTLAVVDEGLLDITRFKTPDPWQNFYAKEALGIRTWDYFDDIMGAFGGVIAKNFAIGGDQELDPSGKKRLNRFTPVVKVLGPFTLAAGATAKHKFTMPNYIGSVRVMLVARHEEAYGNAEKAVPVRKALMVLATLPRLVGPGEKLRLPVQVFAMKDHVKEVKVVVKTNSFFTAEQKSATLNFKAIGDQMAYFELDVAEKTGKGVVDVTVTSGNESATYQVELDVRNPNAVETRNTASILKAGESKTYSLEKFGMAGSNKVSIQASGIPELNLQEAIAYLTRYPHGCIEQTISAAMPQLYLPDLSELTVEQKSLVKRNVLYALTKLQSNQLGNGAFATWPSSTHISEWTTSYAGHFILEAEKHGFGIPAGMKERWLKFEKSAASTWQYPSNESWRYMEQGYRLYVLALAGQPDLGAMNRFRNIVNTKESAWRLAAAYILVGQKSVALELMNKEYSSLATNYYDPTFGNEMRAAAMRLENYILLKDDPKAFEQAVILAKSLSYKNLYTTQGTAFALLNMANYLAYKESGMLKFSWKAGTESKTIEQSKQLYLYNLSAFSNQISVTNNGKSDLYINITQQGQPLPGNESVQADGVKASVEFRSLSGDIISPNSIPQGSDFKAIVTISSTADRYKLHDMALTQIFPSGWEISNTRLLEIDDISSQSYAQYKDIRDDRVYTYFGISNVGSRTYEVRLNAAYVGNYYMPGVHVEAMYYPEVVYIGKGQWVEVVAAK